MAFKTLIWELWLSYMSELGIFEFLEPLLLW
jgi:hypothetical protein